MKWRYPIIVGIVIAYTTGIVPSCTEAIGSCRIRYSTSYSPKSKPYLDNDTLDSFYSRLAPLYREIASVDSVRKIFPCKEP